MLASTVIRRSTSRLERRVYFSPKTFVQNSVAYFSSLGDTISKKEKVEEDRYMRARDQEWFQKMAKKREEAEAAEKLVQDITFHDEVVAPIMHEVEDLLKETGDSISKEGLEALARWKADKDA